MNLRSVAAGAMLIAALTACGSGGPTTTAPQSTVTTSVASPAPATTKASVAGPATITLSSGEVEYLMRNQDGTYECWAGLTAVNLNVSNANGAAIPTTYNGVKFEIKRSDGTFWLTFQQTKAPLMALIFNGKLGYKVPEDAWSGTRNEGGPDLSLDAALLKGDSLETAVGCVAVF